MGVLVLTVVTAQRERWEECLDTLALLHGNGDRSNPIVLAEYEEVKEAQRIAAQAQGIGFLSLFGPRIWKRTLAGCSVQMWQQLLGGNVVSSQSGPPSVDL